MNRIGRLLSALSVFASLAVSATFYVSNTGDDSNPGTSARPWRTVQHAADLATPGATISVRGGTYCQQFTVKVSGNEKQGYITFRSHPGEAATLDGSCLTPAEGRTGMVMLESVSYVRIQGFEIRSYRTDDRRRTPAGIRVGGSGTHIELRDNNVHHIETNYPKGGANAFGIAVYGTDAGRPISQVLIDGNEVHHLKTGSSESLVVNGNVTDFRITRNIVHDNNNIGIDVIGFERTAADPAVDQARDGVVSDNLVYNITSRGNPSYGNEQSSDGIYVDGGTRILIERNVIHHVDIGIELASEHRGRTTSHVTARSNLVYASNTAGISIGGYGAIRGGTDNCTVVNNTLYGNDTSKTGSGEFQMQYNMTDNTFSNNIVYAGGHGRFTSSKSGSADGNTPTVVSDYNLYYLPSGSDSGRWEWNRAVHAGFDAWVKATGNDRHSRFADPLFVNAGANDFHLRPGSPAIDAGGDRAPDNIGGQDLDRKRRLRGRSVDLGCYEVQ